MAKDESAIAALTALILTYMPPDVAEEAEGYLDEILRIEKRWNKPRKQQGGAK